MTFPSKVDWWLGLILAALPFTGVPMILAGRENGDVVLLWTGIGMSAVCVAILVVLIVPMRYELGPDALIIHNGLLRSRIPYDRITRVEPSRSPLSAPALSLDRLAIHHGTRFAQLISPRDRRRFLAELARRAPHLSPHQGGLRSGDG